MRPMQHSGGKATRPDSPCALCKYLDVCAARPCTFLAGTQKLHNARTEKPRVPSDPLTAARQVSDVRERRYEASGLGSLYLFRIDDEIVVDATKRVRVAAGLLLCSNLCCEAVSVFSSRRTAGRSQLLRLHR